MPESKQYAQGAGAAGAAAVAGSLGARSRKDFKVAGTAQKNAAQFQRISGRHIKDSNDWRQAGKLKNARSSLNAAKATNRTAVHEGLKAAKYGGKARVGLAGAIGAGAVATGLGAKAVRPKQKVNKSMTESAFGIDHGDIAKFAMPKVPGMSTGLKAAGSGARDAFKAKGNDFTPLKPMQQNKGYMAGARVGNQAQRGAAAGRSAVKFGAQNKKPLAGGAAAGGVVGYGMNRPRPGQR